ncbi:MAG: nucleotidyltransferase family protein [Pseudomonadota bacterium]
MTEKASLLCGLIPAAGASRRMGRDKRQIIWRSRSILETTVHVLQSQGIRPIIVVLEPDSPCQDLPGLAETHKVYNPNPDRGMLSSIREGLRAVPKEALGVAILPGDHPFVPSQAIQALMRCFAQDQPRLLIPRYSGRKGHPLILHRDLFDQASACDDQVGLRELVWRREADLQILDLNMHGADDDLDTPEDLWKLG